MRRQDIPYLLSAAAGGLISDPGTLLRILRHLHERGAAHENRAEQHPPLGGGGVAADLAGGQHGAGGGLPPRRFAAGLAHLRPAAAGGAGGHRRLLAGGGGLHPADFRGLPALLPAGGDAGGAGGPVPPPPGAAGSPGGGGKGRAGGVLHHPGPGVGDVIACVKSCGIRAVTYMPTRNTPEQLTRLRRLCDENGLFQVSGEDINSPRQSFVIKAMENPLFSNLIDATWKLIEHEKTGSAIC